MARHLTARGVLLLAALGAPALSPSAQAQAQGALLCGARDSMVQRLEVGLGESVRSIGLARQNHIVEVYASSETGTWSITVTNAEGVTCLVASGHYFETLTPRPAGDPL